jgi:hypothetical protein
MNGKIVRMEEEPGGTMRLTLELECGKIVVFEGCLVTGIESADVVAEEVKFVPVGFSDSDLDDKD